MRDETKCLHAGYSPKNSEPRVMPIVQSTTYVYDSTADVAAVFDDPTNSLIYSRFANPTVMAVEDKIAALEGGVGAMCTTSGQAANLMAVLNICEAGDSLISVTQIYGGTINLFSFTLKKLGIECIYVSPDATDEELDRAFKPNTKLVFGETIANPALSVLDIERFAAAAHAHGVPLIVDNTFATPVLCKPFEFGADIVTHSTTKYMDGHALQVGGVIVDSGKFDWAASGKFPCLTEPDESYHGLVYTEKFGKAAFIAKARAQMMRDIGMAMSPMNAFLLNVGIETLHLRMPVHCSNALAVAEFLLSNPKVAWVEYPGLKNNRYHALAGKYMPNGTCGVISFGIKGGRGAAEKFMESVRLAAPVIHVADVRTCVLHPASTTHRQLSDKQLEECGVTPDLIRMSVGIEYVGDIIADLEAALEKC